MLKKDDWELTLREARSQHNQQLILLEISQAVINMCELRIKSFPKKDETKSKAEQQTF